MPFQLSPGVNISEIDLTTVVPTVATTDGAIAGVFRWGPIGQRILVDSENNLAVRFGKPTNFNAETFFTAANFLAYGNRLYVSRAAKTTGSTPNLEVNLAANTGTSNNIFTVANTAELAVGMYVTQSINTSAVPNGSENLKITEIINATAVRISTNVFSQGTGASGNSNVVFARSDTAYTAVATENNAVVANIASQIVKNENVYSSLDGTFDPDILYLAKYPGSIGNSLKVSVCSSANQFNSNITLTDSQLVLNVGSTVATLTTNASSNTLANTVIPSLSVGDFIIAGNSLNNQQYLTVKTISTVVSNTSLNLTFGNTGTNGSVNAFNGFISINNISNGNLIFNYGDTVVYANAAGNTVTGGLGGGSRYIIFEANSTGVKIAADYAKFLTGTSAVTANASGAGNSHTFTLDQKKLSITFEEPYRLSSDIASNTIQRYWGFFNVVDTPPGQSDYVRLNGNTSASDELHIVVSDEDGLFTGTPGTILEIYNGVSRATDATNNDGSTNYYKTVINENSNYIWFAKDRSSGPSNTALNLVNESNNAPLYMNMSLGADGLSEENATLPILGSALDLFISPEDIDISLVLQGRPIGGTTVVGGETINNFLLANYIIDNICEVRKDCIALISPDKSKVLNNVGNEALSLKNWRGAIRNTSYAVLDSGYKYQYDRYNDIYRWVPLNGDIAGLCVRTDSTNDAWWSPAGFNRGNIKNVVKLSWNPRKAERDVLYSNGINPVVTFPGQGTVLFGDKTLQAKPSAFDRINVRRLFIVLEKAISTAAKFSLFEFNDAFTRAQFKNLVTPYLRNIQGRRGITDFLVVCDDTNNTPAIIDSNQFVGDIYIKPARSINFIQLNFVAVGTGVQFSEVVGKF